MAIKYLAKMILLLLKRGWAMTLYLLAVAAGAGAVVADEIDGGDLLWDLSISELDGSNG